MARTRAQNHANSGKKQLAATNSQDNQQRKTKIEKAPRRSSQSQIKRKKSRALRSLLETSPTPSAGRQSAEPQTDLPHSSRKRQREDRGDLDQPDSRKRARPCQTIQSAICENEDESDPIAYWTREGHWPRNYGTDDPVMDRVLARKKSSSSLRSLSRKRSEPGSTGSATPSDQRPREEKSAPYRDPRYKAVLETKGSFMDESEPGIAIESKNQVSDLLGSDQTIPENSLFRDDLFKKICRRVGDGNEARVIRDITPLIVPSAEILAIYGADDLDCLIETTNEGWNNSLPLTSTRPQPDYSVGFRRSAFSDDQLEKLSPFIGNFLAGDQSFFMATYLVYFPFLSCEVKCGIAALDTADRQNAHTMTLAVRGVLELFRLVGREKEVDRQILAFSISHDHRIVRIYGHYSVIQGKEAKYYRHPIRTFDFTELDGRDRWSAYRFTKNIYHTWMPSHFKRICSAIDKLPSHLNFDVPPLTETGLSRDLVGGRRRLSQADVDSTGEPEQSSIASTRESTPGTSFTGSGEAKRQRHRNF